MHITGSFDGWSGWGIEMDENGGLSTTLTDGNYDFQVLCVSQADTTWDDGDAPWWDDVWGNSTQYGAPSGSSCEQPGTNNNYAFSVAGADLTVAHCAGICEATCSASLVTFDIDGMDDCGFVSIHANFPDANGNVWSGWGAHTDTNMQATIPKGDWEFVILCVDNTVDGWYNDIFANSVMINPPSGSCLLYTSPSPRDS